MIQDRTVRIGMAGPEPSGGRIVACHHRTRMPLIEAKVQRGALTDEQLDDLAGRLTAVASDAEGSDLERAKPVTWVTVDEVESRHWGAGGSRLPSEQIAGIVGAEMAENGEAGSEPPEPTADDD